MGLTRSTWNSEITRRKILDTAWTMFCNGERNGIVYNSRNKKPFATLEAPYVFVRNCIYVYSMERVHIAVIHLHDNGFHVYTLVR